MGLSCSAQDDSFEFGVAGVQVSQTAPSTCSGQAFDPARVRLRCRTLSKKPRSISRIGATLRGARPDLWPADPGFHPGLLSYRPFRDGGRSTSFFIPSSGSKDRKYSKQVGGAHVSCKSAFVVPHPSRKTKDAVQVRHSCLLVNWRKATADLSTAQDDGTVLLRSR
jgi:hypothetical protein